jgi:predicted nucleotidyltransferase
MNFGLRAADIQFMHILFQQHLDIEQVWVYGSRAKGTNQPGSDVDLALIGPDVKGETVKHIHFVLEEESPMPFFFDVLHWNTLSNQKLKDEIQRTAQPLYQRLP